MEEVVTNAVAQLPAAPLNRDVGKGRSAPPVSCSGLFGPAVSLLACAPRDLNSRPCVCGTKAPEHALRRLKETAGHAGNDRVHGEEGPTPPSADSLPSATANNSKWPHPVQRRAFRLMPARPSQEDWLSAVYLS